MKITAGDSHEKNNKTSNLHLLRSSPDGAHRRSGSGPVRRPVLRGRDRQQDLWPDAKAAAESRSYNGVEGHLVTIGSRAEDEFVDALRSQVVGESGSEFWVGGYQTACATATPEPACGWLWINGEPISPTNTASPYTNWQSGQPNNATPSAKEDFLAIGAGSHSGWNDEGSTTPIAGYVVEYGDSVTVPATTCAETGGCNPTGGQIQQYPDSAVVQLDATLTARTWLVHDDPARCGVLPLELFDRCGDRSAVPVRSS